MTTVDQQTALEKVKVNTAWFFELQFVSGTVRVCSYNQTFTWGGYDWTGLGSLGSIGNIDESASIGSSPMLFGLNVAQTTILSLAVGDVEDYRGQPAILYFCPLTEAGALIDTPEQCWSGTMDVMNVGQDKESGNITLKCESSVFNLKRRSSARINHAQQLQRYPTDTGLQYLNDLLYNPQPWLTARFQMI